MWAPIPGLGRPVQIAYAVRDLEAAVERFSRHLGAGPFFVMEHIPLADVRHRGGPGAFDHSSAYGQWGEVMVELVRDHTSGPSAVKDLLGEDGEGLHHLAFMVPDLHARLADLAERGWAEAMLARTGTGVEFAFVDASADLGHMIELYEPGEGLLGFYAMVKEAARDWDGQDPLRRL